MKNLLLYLTFILFPILTFAQISGDKIIGSNQPAPYNSLTNAVAHVNNVGVSGPVRFLLDDASYSVSTGELFPIKIAQFGGSSAANTLTIKPNVNNIVTVIGTDATVNYELVSASAIFKFEGADNIIIDGSNSVNGTSRDLTLVNNQNVTYNFRSIIWIASVGNNGANNISTINTKMKMGFRNQGNTLVGVFSGANVLPDFSTELPTNGMATEANSNMTIKNNEFFNVRQAIVVRSSADEAKKSANIQISLNTIGSTEEVQKPLMGIQFVNVKNSSILDNTLNGLGRAKVGGDNYLTGIDVFNSTNIPVQRNIIENITFNSNSIIVYGIRATGTSSNVTISENQINSIKTVDNGRIHGIDVNTPSGAGMLVANNFISGISSAGTTTNTGHGIYMQNGGTSAMIYHNTIAMNAPQAGTSAAIYFAEGTGYDVRNNIFSNTSKAGSTNPNGDGLGPYAIFSNIAPSAFTTINNNNYFSPVIGYISSTVPHTGHYEKVRYTITEWKAAVSAGSTNTGKDLNSISVNPVFVSTTDLHLQSVPGNAALDNKGTALPAITMNIDGQIRSTTTPDMGADEFSAVPAAITISSSSLPTFSSCSQTTSASQSFTISGTNLTADIVVTAPAGFEVSKADITFSNSVTYTQTSGSVASSMVYARMKPTSAAVSGSIAITSTNADTKDITVSGNVGATTTWSGSTWSAGIPTSTMAAIISGNYQEAANINACSLTVNTNAVVVIPTGYTVNLNGAITVVDGSSFTLENNASLIQNGASNTNSGNITVKRYSSALKRLDYTLWSSPTSGTSTQTLQNFSPLTTANRFYTYKTDTNLYSAVAAPGSTNFSTAKGYLIRMPNTHPTTATVWEAGAFTGIPNNGDYNLEMTNIEAGKRFNLVGNPYPSPIDAKTFVTANSSNITGALYFWRKTNDATQPSYYTWTTAGTTGPITKDQTVVAPFQGVIQTGQGFFVEAKESATNLIFTNAMRKDDHANQFYKSSEESTIEYNRIWLNATNAAGWSSQTLIAYFTEGQDGLDASDGRYINDGDIAFTSLIEGVPYAIQGKALPFRSSDTVPMQLVVKNAGTYTIAIDHVDGLFEGDQDIFLRDNFNGTVTNLKLEAYNFTTEAGSFNSRFEIVFSKGVLSVIGNAFDKNSVVLYKKENEVVVQSKKTMLDSVEVFDMNGRLLGIAKNIKDTKVSMNVGRTNQVLIFKITSADGKIVSKKLIN